MVGCTFTAEEARSVGLVLLGQWHLRKCERTRRRAVSIIFTAIEEGDVNHFDGVGGGRKDKRNVRTSSDKNFHVWIST